MEQKDKNPAPVNTTNNSSKPNESSGIIATGYIKIFDPNSKEVFVSKRS